MGDYFEIDFLDVETQKSGDAIPLRYELNGEVFIHVVDGGFQETGSLVVDHINNYYENPTYIDHVVATHPDGDHAGGLRTVLETFNVGNLWMLRPWKYAADLIDRFDTYNSVDHLAARLRRDFPNLAALEDIALERGIEIKEPFQGVQIGAFTVLAPTKPRYLDLIVESEKTPDATVQESVFAGLIENLRKVAAKTVNFVKSAWGAEIFPDEDTSTENNMSVVQYANLCGKRILLTADAGRAALNEAADYAPFAGLALPGIDRMQIPHHGSRHNVSTELLDRWLGKRLTTQLPPGERQFTAIVSAAKADKDHPRKAVVRAFIHRGASVISTEDGGKRTNRNAPERNGWVSVESLPYPTEQED